MTLDEVTEEVSVHLDEIKKFFKPGALITIIVRFPDDPEGRKDFMMSDDTPQPILNLVARRMAAGEVKDLKATSPGLAQRDESSPAQQK